MDGRFLLLVVEGKSLETGVLNTPELQDALQEKEPAVLLKRAERGVEGIEGEGEGERRTSQRTALYHSATRQELLLL